MIDSTIIKRFLIHPATLGIFAVIGIALGLASIKRSGDAELVGQSASSRYEMRTEEISAKVDALNRRMAALEVRNEELIDSLNSLKQEAGETTTQLSRMEAKLECAKYSRR